MILKLQFVELVCCLKYFPFHDQLVKKWVYHFPRKSFWRKFVIICISHFYFLVHISHQNALLNNGHSNRRRCQNYSPLILSFIRRVLCWRGIKRTDEEWKRGEGGIVKCVSGECVCER